MRLEIPLTAVGFQLHLFAPFRHEPDTFGIRPKRADDKRWAGGRFGLFGFVLTCFIHTHFVQPYLMQPYLVQPYLMQPKHCEQVPVRPIRDGLNFLDF